MSRSGEPVEHPQTSRGGQKLAAALQSFGVDPTGLACADLGSNVGGFVDCLLRRGARRVYAVDTSYGVLAYALRTDPRVVVLERTNAMHVRLPEPVDLVTIDVAWTPQHRILPNAMTLLASGGRIITLIKPHYEAPRSQLRKGLLDPKLARESLEAVCRRIADLGLTIEHLMESPIAGRKKNIEYLALLSPRSPGLTHPGRP